jgi:hypothetical protein
MTIPVTHLRIFLQESAIRRSFSLIKVGAEPDRMGDSQITPKVTSAQEASRRRQMAPKAINALEVPVSSVVA